MYAVKTVATAKPAELWGSRRGALAVGILLSYSTSEYIYIDNMQYKMSS
jgi:hypothetical protein